MAFKASKGKSGLFEIHGLELFIEKKVAELRKALGLATKAAPVPAPAPVAKPVPVVKAAPVAKPAKKAAAPAKKSKAAAKATAPAADPLHALLAALEAHPKKAALIKAGKLKDQLLRSLIPLYVGAKAGIDVSSGTTSKFWSTHGITYAAPNAAKALREHVGYARRTAKGVQITPNGIKYVEQAISGKRTAA